MITRGDPLSGDRATVGGVVRIVPQATCQRRTISLPPDILLLIFENLRFPLAYRGWRQDLLNCALVCRRWTCALNVLLIDFHSPQTPWDYPPEMTSFANALVARPSLGLGIKYLSAHYFWRHSAWDPYFEEGPPATLTSPRALANLQLYNSRRAPFAKVFLSILRMAKNVQNLSTDHPPGFLVSPDDLADALSGHNTLDTFDAGCVVTMAQLLSSIATCSSLKCLTISNVIPRGRRTTVLPTPSFQLTELEISSVPIRDDELACLANASALTLQRFTLNWVSHLTNAGLGAALTAVCMSLTYLCIRPLSDFERDQEEEHALDAVIARMERLTDLKISPAIASECMVKRRAEAFVRSTTIAAPVLPEVRLDLNLGYRRSVDQDGLGKTMARDWPGWRLVKRGV